MPPPVVQEAEEINEIVSVDNGSWVLSVPVSLHAHKSELESLINKVFANRPQSPDNVALAKQLSLNWCVSKCKQVGLPPEETLGDLAR